MSNLYDLFSEIVEFNFLKTLYFYSIHRISQEYSNRSDQGLLVYDHCTLDFLLPIISFLSLYNVQIKAIGNFRDRYCLYHLSSTDTCNVDVVFIVSTARFQVCFNCKHSDNNTTKYPAAQDTITV